MSLVFTGNNKLTTWLLDKEKGKVDCSRVNGISLASRTRCLSLKYCYSGEEKYHILNNTFSVKNRTCLVLPENEAFDAQTLRNQVSVGICVDIGIHYLNPDFYEDELNRSYSIDFDWCYGMMLKEDGAAPLNKRLIHAIEGFFSNGKNGLDQRMIEIVGYLMLLQQELNNKSSHLLSKTKAAKQIQVLKLEKAKDYIQSSVHESLHLERLSKEVGLSMFHLQRLFKDYHGVTPQQFHEALRMQKAQQYLVTLGASVKEVALLLGYIDPKYFSRRFKLFFGYPPSVLAR